jgi:coatomer subunit zeta
MMSGMLGHNVGDIILYDSHLAVYKNSLDVIFYLITGPSENELMISSALNALSLLLKGQVEKRGVLENLDLMLLCLDETIDDGCVATLFFHPSYTYVTSTLPSIIVDTDSTAIASRVSRPRPDTTDIVINEQTIMNAYQTVKEKMQQRIQQL